MTPNKYSVDQVKHHFVKIGREVKEVKQIV